MIPPSVRFPIILFLTHKNKIRIGIKTAKDAPKITGTEFASFSGTLLFVNKPYRPTDAVG